MNYSEVTAQDPQAPELQEGPVRCIPFTKAQESAILRLVLFMQVAAGASLVRVGITIVAAAQAGQVVSASVDVMLSLAFAILTFQAASAFKKVATTDVEDQRLVVDGIDKMRTLFLVKAILNLIALALGFAAICLFIFVLVMGTMAK